MSNYTKATNFATKDALTTGNPLKTLSGTELDDEFNAIQVANNTKANASNAALTGTPVAPTAATATSTTQIATTAFVQANDALQLNLAGGAMTGAITTNSTIDGRDVAADGVLATNALPKSGGAMTGAITTNSTFDGVDIATRDGVLTSTTATANAALPKAGGTMTGHTLHGDNVNNNYGAGDDLKIYHNGANSYINNTTGSLYIRDSDGDIIIQAKNNENSIVANNDGSVQVYYDNAEKLATTATGVDISGTVTADGLVVDGVATLNNHVKVADGYSIGWGDITTRFTGNSAGDFITATTAGSERMRIDSSGNVGIGTSSPQAGYKIESLDSTSGESTPLVIANRDTTVGTTQSVGLNFGLARDSGAFKAQAGRILVGRDGNTWDGADSKIDSFMSFSNYTNNALTEKMRIDSSGNVLVGKTSPTISTAGVELRPNGQLFATQSGNYPLLLNRTTNDGAIAEFRKDGTTVGSIGTVGGDTFIGSGITGVRFYESQNRIIPVSTDSGGGSTNGATSLGGSGMAFKDLYLSGQVNTGTVVTTGHVKAADGYSIGWGDLTTRFTGNSAGDFITATTAGTERMRIDSSGSVSINSAPGTGVRLNVKSTGNQHPIVLTSTVAGYHVAVMDNNATSGTRQLVSFRIGNISKGGISSNGTTVTYGSNSDYRLKTDVQPMTGATATFMQLKPVNFEWISSGERVDGFLAHELQEVIPAAATGTKDGMMDEEYEVSPATGDVYTAGSEAGFNEVSPAIQASPAYYDIDGVQIKAEVVEVSAVHEAIAAVAEIIHSSGVEQTSELEEGQQWRETTAQVMGTRSVPDMQGIDQAKVVPLMTATIQELIARIEALEAGE